MTTRPMCSVFCWSAREIGWKAKSSPAADTAIRNATQFGWPPADELLLYIIHGALHLVGFDDTTDELEAVMRTAESEQLALFGLKPHWE